MFPVHLLTQSSWGGGRWDGGQWWPQALAPGWFKGQPGARRVPRGTWGRRGDSRRRGGRRMPQVGLGTSAEAALGGGGAGEGEMLGGRPAPRGVLSPGPPVFLAAKAKNSPPGGIPGSFLPCAPLTWDRGASSRVSSGRNPRLAGGRGRAAGEGRDGRTVRRTDTASALAPWHDGERPAAAVPAAVAVGAGLCPGA